MDSTTQDNTVAIAELVVIAKQTNKDLDRVIKHMDSAPIARTIALEKRMNTVETRLPLAISKSVIMWGVVLLLGTVGSVLGLGYYEIKDIQRQLHKIDTMMATHNETKLGVLRRITKLENRYEK